MNARKPPIPAHRLDEARAASLMQALQSLPDLKLKKVGVELVGPCPRCGVRDRFAINTTTGSFPCHGCEAKGEGGIALAIHVRGRL